MVVPGTFGSFSLNTGFACTGRGSSAASSRGTPNNAVARTKPAAPETQRLIDVSMIGPRCAQNAPEDYQATSERGAATSERQALVHDQVPAHRPDAAVSDHHDVPDPALRLVTCKDGIHTCHGSPRLRVHHPFLTTTVQRTARGPHAPTTFMTPVEETRLFNELP